MRGGENVVEALCDMFPEADVFAHVYDPAEISESIKRHRVRTTFIHRLPGAVRHYKRYLALMPLALEQLDLREYDLVISVESGPAKGVIVAPGALHLCYCLSPMRYLWDMYPDYLAGAGRITRLVMRPVMHYLRMWDYTSAGRVSAFGAISGFVAQRVKTYYGREAQVIFPPVNTGAFAPDPKPEDFYLMVGQLVRYKRFDLAIDAFNRLGRKLVIIGGGEQQAALKRMAGPTVKILGRQTFDVIREHYSRCRALVFPGVEDFGIVPVEAMASGRPVIAFRKGGVLDTVIEGKTGLFFDEQTPESLIDAVRRFEAAEHSFRPDDMIRHARQFDISAFKDRMGEFIQEHLDENDRGASGAHTDTASHAGPRPLRLRSGQLPH